MCQTSVNLTPCCIKHKVLILDMCRSILSIHVLSKKAQRIKCGRMTHSVKETGQQKEHCGWGVGCDNEGGGGGRWTKFEKREGKVI